MLHTSSILVFIQWIPYIIHVNIKIIFALFIVNKLINYTGELQCSRFVILTAKSAHFPFNSAFKTIFHQCNSKPSETENILYAISAFGNKSKLLLRIKYGIFCCINYIRLIQCAT